MAISLPRRVIMSLVAATDGADHRSTPFEIHPAATQVSLFALFTQAGTLDVDYIDPASGAQQIATAAVTANTLAAIHLTYNPGTLRARFAPSAGPVSGTIEAMYSGHGGGLS
jgi:hypothetical protein